MPLAAVKAWASSTTCRVCAWWTKLEERYPAFDGLNLCFETREGILKHCSRANALRLEQQEPGGVGARFLKGGIALARGAALQSRR